MDILKKHACVFEVDVVPKLLSFGVDSVNVFQGVKYGVTHQIQDKYAPRLEGIHYMAHHTN
jgi:hypothetical protein